MSGEIIQINIKPKKTNEVGLPKLSVNSAFFSKKNVGKDYNNYRMTLSTEHINNRSVLIYPIELIDELNSEGWPVKPGDLGENITTRGIDYSNLKEGVKYKLGENVIIEITEICNPCSNLTVLPYVGKEKINTFIETLIGRRGMFAKVLQEGTVEQGTSMVELN